MKVSSILNLFLTLLPVGEQIASIFIHNPNSQHQFSMIVGEVNEITPIAQGIAAAYDTAAVSTPLSTPPAAPAPATPTEPTNFVPAGTPSAH